MTMSNLRTVGLILTTLVWTDTKKSMANAKKVIKNALHVIFAVKTLPSPRIVIQWGVWLYQITPLIRRHVECHPPFHQALLWAQQYYHLFYHLHLKVFRRATSRKISNQTILQNYKWKGFALRSHQGDEPLDPHTLIRKLYSFHPTQLYKTRKWEVYHLHRLHFQHPEKAFLKIMTERLFPNQELAETFSQMNLLHLSKTACHLLW